MYHACLSTAIQLWLLELIHVWCMMRGPWWLLSLILIRIAPIPLGLKNYGLALAPSIDFTLFTVASAIVNVPFSIMWCLLGSQAKNLGDALRVAKKAGGKASAALVGAGTGVVLVVLLTKRWLKSRQRS